jgi:hypothetical protein
MIVDHECATFPKLRIAAANSSGYYMKDETNYKRTFLYIGFMI